MTNDVFYHITMKSANRKVGKIPVTTSTIKNCPDTCSLKSGLCYALSGPMAIFWRKLSEGTAKNMLTFKEYITKIKSIPEGTPIRINQAGDLAQTKDGRIDRNKLKSLISATRHLKPFLYTHHRDDDTIEWANAQGFPLIKSCDSVEQLSDKVPNSLVISHEYNKLKDETNTQYRERTHASFEKFRDKMKEKGMMPFICPAITSDTSCDKCMACANMKPGQIVAFAAHGSSRKKINTEV